MAELWMVELWRRDAIGRGDWYLVNPAYRGPFNDKKAAYGTAGLLDSFNDPYESYRVVSLYVGRHRRG